MSITLSVIKADVGRYVRHISSHNYLTRIKPDIVRKIIHGIIRFRKEGDLYLLPGYFPMSNSLNSLANNLSPAARDALVEFLARVKKVEKQIADTALSILVWGPGDRSSDKLLYQNRCKIRDELRRQGNAAIFSEEIANSTKQELPVTLSELAQAISADFIVVLMASWGALSEIDEYGRDPEIASKILILLPRQSRRGFTERVLLEKGFRSVIYFNQSELESYSVVDKIIERLPALKCAKFMYQRQKRRWESLE